MVGTLNISKGVYESIVKGKLVFTSNEIRVPSTFRIGELVKLVYNNKIVAWGSVNPKSFFKLRILEISEEFDINEFLVKKLESAKSFREKVLGYKNVYRWVYSESDGISGLIIDRYNNSVVIENSNPFIERNLNVLTEILVKKFDIKNIVLKGQYRSRVLEGLPPENKILYGDKTEEIIKEGKAKFYVNFIKGQKTGFYLDQRENRLLLEKIAFGKVLDLFSYSGGFGIHSSFSNNTDKIVFVEKSSTAIEFLKRNIELNELEEYEIIKKDVLKFLKNANERYDTIILDPSGLAVKGIPKYKAMKYLYLLNRLAISKLNKPGILVTCDCSQHIKYQEFRDLLFKVFYKENVNSKLFYVGFQSPDHPVYPMHPELFYLKCLFFYID